MRQAHRFLSPIFFYYRSQSTHRTQPILDYSPGSNPIAIPSNYPTRGISIGLRFCQMAVLILLLVVPAAARAASVTLAWDPVNTAQVTYCLFLRTANQTYDYSNPAWQGDVAQCTLNQLDDGQTYYAVVRALIGSEQSGDSNEVTFTTAPAAINHSPVANAGGDLAVSAGATVTLDGSGSHDPDGDIITYEWTQASGQAVMLTGDNNAKASFTAPEVGSSAIQTFQLNVTDDQGVSSVDTCQVTIVPVLPTDSDNDGLSDTDETTIYHTDPTKADSDGDGINDGDEIASGTDPMVPEQEVTNGKIWLEAEDGDFSLPMQIDGDADASEEAYLWAPQGSGNQTTPSSSAGAIQYTFSVDISGTYRIWARVMAPSSNDDSFFVSMDGSAYKIWDTARSTSWIWDLVNARNGADPLEFQLSAGTHTLTIMQREDGTKLDRILITSDAQYVPQGQGDAAQDVPQDPGGQDAGNGDNIAIEAESGIATLPMTVGNDSGASSGSFLWVPQGSGNQTTPSSSAGTVQYTFSVDISGTYRIWGRVMAPNGSDDSFFVSMDGSAYTIWDTARSTSWIWDLVNARKGADPLEFQLSAGTHTLTIMQREDGTKLDKLIITMDSSFAPQ
jgi:hypothetical protein